MINNQYIKIMTININNLMIVNIYNYNYNQI